MGPSEPAPPPIRRENPMNETDVRRRAFAMPLTSPAYPKGPYRFIDREYLIITYETDTEALRAVVPEPLQIEAPLVKYEFIRMPNSTGFGDYTESGQVIPVSSRAARAAIRIACSWTIMRRSPAGASSGAFRRSSPRQAAYRNRHAGRHAGLRPVGSRPGRWATSTATPTRLRAGEPAGAEFPAQDHSACRRHGPHLRAGRIRHSRTSASKAPGSVRPPCQLSAACAGAGRRAAGPRASFRRPIFVPT